MKKFYYLLALLLWVGTMNSQVPGQIVNYTKKLDLTPEGVITYINNLKNKDTPEELIAYISQFSHGLVAYKVTYYTTDLNRNPIKATGLIMYPKIHFKLSTLVYCHPTTDHRDNVPSNLKDVVGVGFLIPLGYALSGYIIVAPDYMGMGDGDGHHLYVNAETEANATIDLMKASEIILSELKIKRYDEYFLTGYSQGGHAAMSTLKMMKEKYNNLYNFKYAHFGAGPYDLSDTTLNTGILQKETYPFSAFVANIIYSCHESGFPQYTSSMDEVISPAYINSFNKKVINEEGGLFWGPILWEKLFTSDYVNNVRSNPNHYLRKCFKSNNVYNWYNRTPTTLGHASVDFVVPKQNSEKAKDVQKAFYPSHDLKKHQIKTQNYGPATHIGGTVVHFLASTFKFNSLRKGGFFNQFALLFGRTNKPESDVSIYETSLLNPLLYIDQNDVTNISYFSDEESSKMSMKKSNQLSNLPNGIYLLKLKENENQEQLVPFVKDTPIEVPENEVVEFDNSNSLKLKANDEEIVQINIFDSNLNLVKSINSSELISENNTIDTSDFINNSYTFEIVYNTYTIMFNKEFNKFSLEENFKVYTSSHKIYIRSAKNITNIDIFNINGNNVWNDKIQNYQKEIVSKELNPGIYFIKIQFIDGSHKTSKVSLK